jgi:hypothetical protein
MRTSMSLAFPCIIVANLKACSDSMRVYFASPPILRLPTTPPTVWGVTASIWRNAGTTIGSNSSCHYLWCIQWGRGNGKDSTLCSEIKRTYYTCEVLRRSKRVQILWFSQLKCFRVCLPIRHTQNESTSGFSEPCARISNLISDHDDASVYTPAMQERVYRGDAGYVPVPSRCSGTSYASVVYHRALTRATRCFMRG